MTTTKSEDPPIVATHAVALRDHIQRLIDDNDCDIRAFSASLALPSTTAPAGAETSLALPCASQKTCASGLTLRSWPTCARRIRRSRSTKRRTEKTRVLARRTGSHG